MSIYLGHALSPKHRETTGISWIWSERITQEGKESFSRIKTRFKVSQSFHYGIHRPRKEADRCRERFALFGRPHENEFHSSIYRQDGKINRPDDLRSQWLVPTAVRIHLGILTLLLLALLFSFWFSDSNSAKWKIWRILLRGWIFIHLCEQFLPTMISIYVGYLLII